MSRESARPCLAWRASLPGIKTQVFDPRVDGAGQHVARAFRPGVGKSAGRFMLISLLAIGFGGIAGMGGAVLVRSWNSALPSERVIADAPASGSAPAPSRITTGQIATVAPTALPFDAEALQGDVAAVRVAQERLEQGLRLLPGGPAPTEALRKRLLALESGPQPIGEAQLARNAAALDARITQLEGIVADFLRLQAAANRFGGMESLGQGLRQARTDQHASGTELVALRGELDRLRQDVIASRSEAASAGRAARGALALASVSEAAQRTGPFSEAMRALSIALSENPQVQALAVLAVQGAPSRPELLASFAPLDARLDQAVRAESAGPSVLGQMQAVIARQVSVKPVAPKGVPQGPLDSARLAIARGDLAGAVGALGQLDGRAAQEARLWLDGARRRLEIEGRLAAIRAELAKG